MDIDSTVGQDENLRLAELLFLAKHGDKDAASELKVGLIERKALHFLRKASTALVGHLGCEIGAYTWRESEGPGVFL